MKLKMSEKSLFAILLRSPWWVSMIIVAVIALLSGALLPTQYVVLGVMGSFPLMVIAVMAAWRQRHAAHPAQIAKTLEQLAAMSWRDFSLSLEQALVRQGNTVTRLNNAAADFSLLKDARVTLVSCKRWKAANLGVDALRDLVGAKEAQGADQTLYISLGNVSDNARRFAKDQGIELMPPSALAQMFLDQKKS